MDSQQCLIQCPNCQPIRCPINSQGLYLLPATAYNTIDVDEYIDRANQASFAAAAENLAHTAIVKQSEQANDDDGAERSVYELSEQPQDERSDEAENHQADTVKRTTRFAAAARARSEHRDDDPYNDDNDDRSPPEHHQSATDSVAATPKRSNVARWASTNRFAALAEEEEDTIDDGAATSVSEHTRQSDPPR
jgi:hypothetical protein